MSERLKAMQRQTQAVEIARRFRAAENLEEKVRTEQRQILMSEIRDTCDPLDDPSPAVALAVQVERHLAVMHGSYYALRWEQMWLETQS